MKYNLKTKPNLEWIINQPRTKERIDDAYVTIVDMKHWFEDFEKELRQRIAKTKKFQKCSASLTEICCFEEILGEDKE